MTGRGIDQILPHPSDPRLRESYVRDAREYVALAERRNGPIAKPATGAYIWGDALAELERVAPDARIVNLETSVTVSDDYWKGKEIHYRMHPGNVDCLKVARIDACGVANNHVLDYGYAGLAETLETLTRAGLQAVGAGRSPAEARTPAVVTLAHAGRVLVFAFAAGSSGVPASWAAREDKPGVDALPDLSEATAAGICERVRRVKSRGDLVVASIHWGSNWDYDVPVDHVRFAHWLVDGGVDLVHGHSSHHPRPMEVYRKRLILYGCGDFINDYEGIEGYEEYRGDLVLMYFASLSTATGELTVVRMTPMQTRNLSLRRTSTADLLWLRETLGRINAPYGTTIESSDQTLTLRWGSSSDAH